jgi:pimeloyl-ACP methyl ester carboxylesterase
VKISPLKILFISLAFVFIDARAQDLPAQCSITNGSISVQGSEIRYFSMGSGKPVLLLHGLFGQKEQWNDFACQLVKVGYAAFAPDLPGYGLSTGFPIDTYRLSKEVDLIHEFVKKTPSGIF